MKKINPQIKDKNAITIQDEIDATKLIADMYFRDIKDEEGTITTEYTPYLEKVGQVNAIIRYFIDGIEVDEGEDVYDDAMKDEIIRPLIDQFFLPYLEDATSVIFPRKLLNQIMDNVYNIVEYKKQLYLAKLQNESNSVLMYKILELIDKEREKSEKEIETTKNLNKWINEQREQQEKLNAVITPEMQKDFIEKFNVETMTEAIYKQISESDLHKKNREIVEANRKIREQDNKIIELTSEVVKEKQKDNVKNTLAGDGKESKPKTTRKRTSKTKKIE